MGQNASQKMTNPNNDPFGYRYNLARKAGLLDDELVARMLNVLAIRPDDRHAQEYLDLRLSGPARLNELDPDPVGGVPPVDVPGEIPVGAGLKRGEPFNRVCFDLDTFLHGLGVYGMRGYGKTTLLYMILFFLMKHVSVLVFDFKRDFRSLATLAQGLSVFRWEEFVYNPLEWRDGVSLNDVLHRTVSAFCSAFHLLQGSNSFLTREFGLFVGHWGEERWRKEAPTLFEFNDWIYKRLMSGAYLSDDRTLATRAVRNTGAMLETTGNVFNVRKGVDVGLLRTRSCVLELDGMNPIHVEFLTTSLVAEMFQLNIAEGRRHETLRHVLCCDEAHNLFPLNRETIPEEGTPLLYRLFLMSREIGGCGYIFATQNPSKLSQTIRSNLGTKVCFRLSDGRELATVQEGMMLYG